MYSYNVIDNNKNKTISKSNNSLWVIDVEQFPNFHSLCAINVDTGERKDFVIHESRDDRVQYLAWLLSCKTWITFNGINYDYPLVHNILQNRSFFINNSVDTVTKWLYDKSSEIINSESSYISESEAYIQQHDLFKINHYDRPQKSCSLKWLEFSLRWHNLKDLPLAPNTFVSDNQVEDIIKYNYNDVEATLMFWHYCSNNINLRKDISSRYNINATNMSDTSIGKNILAKYYSDFTGLEYDKFKDLRDKSYYVTFNDIISDRIVFKTKELNDVLNKLKQNKSNLLNTGFKEKILFDGVVYDMAKGGLHTHMPACIVEEDEDRMLIDMDWQSYYPGLMLDLKIYPPQLGIEILNILKILTQERLKAKAEGDKSTADSLKLTINSLYGLMGSKYSFMYSPKSLLRVTVNGQLFLLMFIERMKLESDAKCYYANTKKRWCSKTFLMRENGKAFIYQLKQVTDFRAKGNSGDMVKTIEDMSTIRSEVSQMRYVLNDHRKAA